MSTRAKLLLVLGVVYALLLTIGLLLLWKDIKDKVEKMEKATPVAWATENVFAKDAKGGWYYDTGDGQILGTANLMENLDQETLFVCVEQFNPLSQIREKGKPPELLREYSLTCDGYDSNIRGNHRIEYHQKDVIQ